ncbi:probable histone-lysine N-methyltransferase set-23 [Sitophilus oryzae]|uniref:Probable histone-lysine N-methyltransferase set-23 n=1 Tax=Sitophilus oryzae TaxID=7048 RepID=A0A6J2XVN6_SITOR|nr:probable histone-lysine N-methyltransferase set-23 [Sitophilus oryzae]
MDCVDEYSHSSPQVIYFSKSIPTKEVEKKIEYSNVFCQCVGSCDQNANCACMKQSGTRYSYTDRTELENYVLIYKNINRPTYECNEQCQCKNTLCGNKLIQCGPRTGLIVKICDDSRKGLGVFTEKLVKCGNFICEYAGEIISEVEASMRFKINARVQRMNYIFCVDEYFGDKNIKTFIDPTFYGNIGRYLNHSCDPNCSMVITRINDNIPVVALFACRDIIEGEELSYDYGITDLSSEIEDPETSRTKCLCGSVNCKGFLPYDTRIM